MNVYVHPAIPNKTNFLTANIYDFTMERFGWKLELKAWQDFLGADTEDYQDCLYFREIFVPWFLYSWIFPGEKTATPSDLYLAENRKQLTDFELHFINSCTINKYSFCQVKEIGLDHYLVVKDLVNNAEFTVFEKLATRCLSPGDIIFCKIARVMDLYFLVGTASIAIPSHFLSLILTEARSRIFKKEETKRIEVYFDILVKTLDYLNEKSSKR